MTTLIATGLIRETLTAPKEILLSVDEIAKKSTDIALALSQHLDNTIETAFKDARKLKTPDQSETVRQDSTREPKQEPQKSQ
jgi:hypothetical protein